MTGTSFICDWSRNRLLVLDTSVIPCFSIDEQGFGENKHVVKLKQERGGKIIRGLWLVLLQIVKSLFNALSNQYLSEQNKNSRINNLKILVCTNV